MRINKSAIAAGLAALIGTAAFTTGDIAAAADDPAGTITPAFNEVIANIPGKSIVAIVVDYPPGGKTPPHHHAHSAFVTGYVLSGEIRSQVDNAPARVYRAGEHWTEIPGAHHGVSENASVTQPAKLLAIFVLDSTETDLTTIER
jgi:quercetin dioxygenase-like cupin family protein